MYRTRCTERDVPNAMYVTRCTERDVPCAVYAFLNEEAERATLPVPHMQCHCLCRLTPVQLYAVGVHDRLAISGWRLMAD